MNCLSHPPTPPPVMIARPTGAPSPLIVASAHSGRDFPQEFLQSSRLDEKSLRASEDGFVDELFEAAPQLGATLIKATFPRVFCDANREAWELDPSMFEGELPHWCNTTSPKVRAGFGTIARVVSPNRPIYRRKLLFSEAQERVARYWQPYHDALSDLITTTVATHGFCCVLDAHSMPAMAHDPAFIIGDAFGTSCAPAIVQRVQSFLTSGQYKVRRNDPFAGGYVTRHYGQPANNVHVFQLEISRRLYMHEASLSKNARFSAIQDMMSALIKDISLSF